jgi:hypothetical protein
MFQMIHFKSIFYPVFGAVLSLLLIMANEWFSALGTGAGHGFKGTLINAYQPPFLGGYVLFIAANIMIEIKRPSFQALSLVLANVQLVSCLVEKTSDWLHQFHGPWWEWSFMLIALAPYAVGYVWYFVRYLKNRRKWDTALAGRKAFE